MNIFDAGGLISFIGVLGSAIIGTAIFIGVHKIFDIVHFGFGAMAGMWGSCFLIAAFIINIFSGMIWWALSIVWLLVKIGVVIGVVGLGVKFTYNKIAENKE